MNRPTIHIGDDTIKGGSRPHVAPARAPAEVQAERQRLAAIKRARQAEQRKKGVRA